MSRFDIPPTEQSTTKPKRKSRFDAPAPSPALKDPSAAHPDHIASSLPTGGSVTYADASTIAASYQRTGFSQGPPSPYHSDPNALPIPVPNTATRLYHTGTLPPPPPPPPPPGAIPVVRYDHTVAVARPPVPHAIELCSVGTMVALLKSHMKQVGDTFEPYSPVPRDISVPTTPVTLAITQFDQTRVEDFYDQLEELFDSMEHSPVIQDKAFDYSRRKHINANKYRSLPLKVVSEQDLYRKQARVHLDLQNTAARATPGFTSSNQHVGLGATTKVQEDDYENFRKKRATQYHEHLAMKDVARRDPNVMLLSSNATCYKCNRLGHHAKDCCYIPD